MRVDVARPFNHAMLKTTLGAMMISFSAVWVKLAHVAPTVSAFYRVFFGGVFLMAILIARREKLWRGWHCMKLSLLAAIFFALDLYTWHRSIAFVGPGLATILGNFEVFLVPVVGVILFGERLNPRFVLSVPLAVTGLFMIVGIDWEHLSPDYRTGIYYGLSTAFFYTGFLIVLRKLQSHASKPSAVLSLMVVSFSTALYLALEMIWAGESFAIPDLQSGLSLLALGLMCQTAGWLLITRSLPRIPAAIAGLILLLQPSLSFVWDVLFFNRATSTAAWAGVILALSAIYVGATSGRKVSATAGSSNRLHSNRLCVNISGLRLTGLPDSHPIPDGLPQGCINNNGQFPSRRIPIETADEKTPATVREIVDLTKDLIRFKSTHTRPEELHKCARFIETWFKDNDIACTFMESNGVPSICALPARRQAPLLLMSHIDVVNAADSLFEPVEKDGRLYGRGAIDDKYAAALSMVLLKNRLEFNRSRGLDDGSLPLTTLITGDEEVGGYNGARSALGRINCEFCIALDGGRVDKIVVKEKGILRLKVVASGKTAHGARPWQGENAIERLMADCLVVKGFFEGLTAPEHWHRSMNLSVFHAGDSVNQVPDKAEATFDIRYTEHDDVDDLVQRIQAAVSGEVITEEREPLFISPESPYRERLLALATETRTGIAHGASDARFLSQFNIPGIVWGADGNSSQHSMEEHVEIRSLSRLYDLLDRFVGDIQENAI